MDVPRAAFSAMPHWAARLADRRSRILGRLEQTTFARSVSATTNF